MSSSANTPTQEGTNNDEVTVLKPEALEASSSFQKPEAPPEASPPPKAFQLLAAGGGDGNPEATTDEMDVLKLPTPKGPSTSFERRKQDQEENQALGVADLVKKHAIDTDSCQFEKAQQVFVESIPKTFAKYDKDGSGKIDIVELKALLDEMGYDLSDDQLQELLAEVDVDNTGTLDLDEFTALLQIWLHAAQFKVLDSAPKAAEDHIDSSIFGRVKAVVPDVPWRWFWELAVLVATVFFWNSVMCSHVFESENRVQFFKVILVPDLLGTIILLVEMIMKLNLARRTDDGQLLDMKSMIAKEYFKFWFWVDLLAMLPLRLISGNPFPFDASEHGFVLNHFRILGMLRLPTMFKSSGLIKVSLSYVHFHFTFMPYFWLFIFFICSLTSFMAINVQFFRDEIELGLRRMEVTAAAASSGSSSTGGTQYEDDTSTTTFAFITYWTLYIMAGVGYGDVAPLTNKLRAFAGFQFLFSFAVNGYFVGAFASLMAEDNIDDARRDEIVKTLAVLDFFSVPTPLTKEILQFKNHILNNDVEQSHAAVVGTLPLEIRNNIIVQSRVPLLRSLYFFEEMHVSSLVRLSERLVVRGALPEEGVVFAGQKNNSMIIVNFGFIDVVAADGSYYHTLKRGDYFGDTGLIQTVKAVEDAKREGKEASEMDKAGIPSTHTYLALQYCDLLVVTPEACEQVMKIIPKFGSTLRTMAVFAKHDYIFSSACMKVHGWKMENSGLHTDGKPSSSSDDTPLVGANAGGAGDSTETDSNSPPAIRKSSVASANNNSNEAPNHDARMLMSRGKSQGNSTAGSLIALNDDGNGTASEVNREEEERILNNVLQMQMKELMDLSMEALKVGLGEEAARALASTEGHQANSSSMRATGGNGQREVEEEIEALLAKERKSGGLEWSS